MSRDSEAELLLGCARRQLTAGSDAGLPHTAPKTIHWERLLHLAKRHGAIPILYQGLRTLPGLAAPSGVLERLSEQYAFQVQHSNALKQSLANLDAFREEQLPILNFKGPELASLAYPDPSLRPFGDIDLLVRGEDVPRASALLGSQGYRLKAEGDWQRFFVKDRGLGVDLHWKLGPEWLPPLEDFDALWGRAQQVTLGTTVVTTLGMEDLLLVLATLFTRDTVTWRQRLIQICDAAGLIRSQSSVDWRTLLERSKRIGARRMILFQIALANILLGLELPAPIATSLTNDTAPHRLARQIAARLFVEADRHRQWDPSESRPGPGFTGHSFLLQVLEQPTHRAHYVGVVLPGLLRRAVTPTTRDREFVSLPALLQPLYYVVRPIRVLWRLLRTGYLILD